MAAELPEPARLRLTRTLAQWRHWSTGRALSAQPRPVEILEGGVSNYSVLVAADTQFVVRIDGVDPRRLGLNRRAEWRALQLASECGLAPAPHYFNPELGSLVCDYLPPQPATPATDSPEAVAALLRRIHRLPGIRHRLDLRGRLLRYEHTLPADYRIDPAWLACRREALALLEALDDRPAGRVLCHNDLLAANRLHSGGRLWAIDWEYSAMGSPWFDLAAIAEGDGLNPDARERLVHAYLEHAPSAAQLQRLERYGAIYRCLELLWLGANARLENPEQWTEPLGPLAERLAAC